MVTASSPSLEKHSDETKPELAALGRDAKVGDDDDARVGQKSGSKSESQSRRAKLRTWTGQRDRTEKKDEDDDEEDEHEGVRTTETHPSTMSDISLDTAPSRIAVTDDEYRARSDTATTKLHHAINKFAELDPIHLSGIAWVTRKRTTERPPIVTGEQQKRIEAN